LVAVAALGFCAFVFYLTTTFERVPASLAQGMQPADFPRLVLAVIVLLTGVMVVQARGTVEKPRKPVPLIVYLTVAAMLGLPLLSQWLDVFLAILVFCIVLPLLWGERRYPLIAAFAIVLPVVIFVLFSMVLEVRFPRGVLINLVY
jgi:putative tricarboxylic transport membrane protein